MGIIDVGTNTYFSAKGTVTYATNNCYVAKAKVVEDGKTNEVMFAGMWKVEGNILTDTVTSASGYLAGTDLSKNPPKNFEAARVVRVDENELVLQLGKKIKRTETEKRSK